MPRILRNLKVNEVSSVDKGAGEGVRIMLMKREFSGKERSAAADSGAAMPDGSYPIKTVQDLKNAIQAIGRAKNPAKAKAHIKSRAKALGQSNLIPDTWKRDTAAAVSALADVVESIAKDDSCDKLAALDEAIEDFNKFLSDDEDIDMTQDEITKAIADAVNKVKAENMAEIAKRDSEIATLKLGAMSAKQRAYYDSLSGDDAKKAFADMSDDDRDAECDKAKTAKRGVADEPVVKALQAQNEEMRKQLDALRVEKAQAEFAKRAVEVGLSVEDGEVMRKAYSGDPEAQAALTKRFAETTKALREQVKTGKLYGEFSKGGPAQSAGAYDELMAKANDLRKVKPDLSEAQAFSKVFEDRANRELVSRYRDEQAMRIASVAAGNVGIS